MVIYSVPSLISALASACTGLPIRKLWINKPLTSVWNTGAFTSVALRGWGTEPRSFLITSELGGADADLLFEVACRKSGESDSLKVAVKLHLHDLWGGLWTTVSVICPPDIVTVSRGFQKRNLCGEQKRNLAGHSVIHEFAIMGKCLELVPC